MRIIKPLVFLAALLLVCGCVRINIRETVSSSGSSELSMSLQAINASAFGWDEKNPCDDFKANESSKMFTQAKCKFDGKDTETVTGKFDRKKAGGLTISGTKYRFDLVKAMAGFNDNKSKGSQMSLPKKKNQTQIDEAKAAGIEYNYYVKLPGSVTKQSGGVVQSDGSVKFDLLELEEKDNPYVESDAGISGILGGITGGDKGAETGSGTKGGTTKPGSSPLDKLKSTCMPGLTLLLAGLGAAAYRLV
jgi:hypothetical protein